MPKLALSERLTKLKVINTPLMRIELAVLVLFKFEVLLVRRVRSVRLRLVSLIFRLWGTYFLS